jgi:putative transposase
MPRRRRIVVDCGYYHIITRGNNRKKIFRVNKDYILFMQLVHEYAQKYSIKILHYCLMPNHVHILLSPEQAQNLSKFMQGILQKYAIHFRKKYVHNGFLFQNRYKSHRIDNNRYLLACGRYIERNPLRAGLITELNEYKWSSYRYYAHGEQDKIITMVDPWYQSLGETESTRRLKYIQQLSEEQPFEHIVDQALRT